MWPFKKRPAAIRMDGLTHLLTVVIACVVTLFPAFTLVPIFAEVGMGWLFFEDEKIINGFNSAYKTYYENRGYFNSLTVSFEQFGALFGYFKLRVIFYIAFLLLIANLYFNLFFKDKCAPYFIHPASIRKSFLRHKIQKIKQNSLTAIRNEPFTYIWGSIVSLILVIAFFIVLPKVYYPFQGWFFGINNTFTVDRFTMAGLYLDVTAKFLIPFIILWLWLSSKITWQILKESKPIRKLSVVGRPSARWGGVGSYIIHDFDFLINKNKKQFYKSLAYKNPIYLGTTTFTSDPKIGGRHFGLDTDSHMLTIAQTGAGKSRDVLHINFAIWGGGLFILDPKGEHAQRTYQLRKDAGFPVYIIDPYGLCSHIKETDCINLLEEIDPYSPSAADDIQAITYACIPPDDKESGGSKHFRETAQMLFSGIVAHVLTKFPQEEQNLTTVYDLFLSGKPDGTLINQEGFFKVLGEMAGNPACGKLPMQGVAMLLSIKEGERGSIYSTFMRSVSWTQSEAIKKVLSKSTFKLDDIKGKKATVYLVLPFGYMRPQSRWVRAIIGLCFKRAEFPKTPNNSDEKALFVLDEFLQLENCRAVQDAFTTLRGAGVKLWLLSQSLSDIKEFYPNHKSMIGACDKQFFGTDDLDDTKYIEDFLGEYETIITEGKEDEPRTQREINKLSTAADIREMIQKSEAGEGYQIVKPTNSLPVSLNLMPCYWVINRNRYGDFKQTIIPPYKEKEETTGDKKEEFLSPEEVIRILKGESKPKPKDKKTSGGIPKTLENNPLRRDINNLMDDFKELKEELETLKNK